MSMKRFLSLVCAASLCFSLVSCGNTASSNSSASNSGGSGSSTSQNTTIDFPNKTMTIICPYGAGGGTDLALRILAECGQDVFGQVINVDNKTGGSGTVGLTETLNAASDGYTLGLTSVDLITLPLLGLAPAEVTRDAFDPICVVNGEPAAIVVKADAKWNTLEEFIEDAKANPGTIQIANAGMGNIWHLAAIGLEMETGASFVHIPYNEGTAQAITGVLGGHVDAIACSAAEADANIKSGDLKVLAVANDERLAAYPDVPTFKECGVDLTIVALRGLCVNADTPDDIKQALKDGFEEVINSEACKQKVEEANMTYMPLNAEETNEMLDSMAGSLEQIVQKYLESAS